MSSTHLVPWREKKKSKIGATMNDLVATTHFSPSLNDLTRV